MVIIIVSRQSKLWMTVFLKLNTPAGNANSLTSRLSYTLKVHESSPHPAIYVYMYVHVCTCTRVECFH